MKFLITGVSGFVGEELVYFFQKNPKYSILGIDKNEDFQKADLRKINQVIKITKNMDAVVHFGAIPVEDSIVNIINKY